MIVLAKRRAKGWNACWTGTVSFEEKVTKTTAWLYVLPLISQYWRSLSAGLLTCKLDRKGGRQQYGAPTQATVSLNLFPLRQHTLQRDCRTSQHRLSARAVSLRGKSLYPFLKKKKFYFAAFTVKYVCLRSCFFELRTSEVTRTDCGILLTWITLLWLDKEKKKITAILK